MLKSRRVEQLSVEQRKSQVIAELHAELLTIAVDARVVSVGSVARPTDLEGDVYIDLLMVLRNVDIIDRSGEMQTKRCGDGGRPLEARPIAPSILSRSWNLCSWAARAINSTLFSHAGTLSV